jgi:hypothetical protein
MRATSVKDRRAVTRVVVWAEGSTVTLMQLDRAYTSGVNQSQGRPDAARDMSAEIFLSTIAKTSWVSAFEV